MNDRKFRVSLSESDSNYLKEVANKLGISESEVIRKGLKLMALYTKTSAKNKGSLILREDDKERELMLF